MMLLTDYLAKAKITRYRCAKDLGVPHSTMWRWTTGRAIPTPANILAIETYTGGKVRANDWIKHAAV